MENTDAPGVRGEPGERRASGRGRDSPDAHFFFAYAIGLAEVDDIFQSSLEFPDLAFSLSIRLVMARRSHDVFDSHCVEGLFPKLRGESGVSVADN